MQINCNLNDPEVKTAELQSDADVSDDRSESQDQDYDQVDGCPLMYWTTWFRGRCHSGTKLVNDDYKYRIPYFQPQYNSNSIKVIIID